MKKWRAALAKEGGRRERGTEVGREGRDRAREERKHH